MVEVLDLDIGNVLLLDRVIEMKVGGDALV